MYDHCFLAELSVLTFVLVERFRFPHPPHPRDLAGKLSFLQANLVSYTKTDSPTKFMKFMNSISHLVLFSFYLSRVSICESKDRDIGRRGNCHNYEDRPMLQLSERPSCPEAKQKFCNEDKICTRGSIRSFRQRKRRNHPTK